ncbi:MAG: hypothetical protein KME55_34640 [Nostoc indistinguendum CM1-VF10]|nr:hypothetical protein [Nostoc indistinguendum CM1-VF10]
MPTARLLYETHSRSTNATGSWRVRHRRVEIYANLKTLLNDYPGKTGKKWVVLRYL